MDQADLLKAVEQLIKFATEENDDPDLAAWEFTVALTVNKI